MNKKANMMNKFFTLIVVLFATHAITLNAADDLNDEVRNNNALSQNTTQLAGLTGNMLNGANSFDNLNNQIRSSIGAISSTDRTGILVNFISGISGDIQSQINQLITFGSSPSSQTTNFNATVQAACAQKIANIYNQAATNPAYAQSIQQLIQTYINSNLLSAADKANFQSYLTPRTQAAVAPITSIQQLPTQAISAATIPTPTDAPHMQVINSQTQTPASLAQPVTIQASQAVGQPITTAPHMQALDISMTPQTSVQTPQSAIVAPIQTAPATTQQAINTQMIQPQITQQAAQPLAPVTTQLTPQSLNQGTQPQLLGSAGTYPMAQQYQPQNSAQSMYVPQNQVNQFQQDPNARSPLGSQGQANLVVDPNSILQSIQAISNLQNLTFKIQSAYKLMQNAAISGNTYNQQIQDAFARLLTEIFNQTQRMQNALTTTVNNAKTTPLLNQQQQNFVATSMVPSLTSANATPTATNKKSATTPQDLTTRTVQKKKQKTSPSTTQTHKKKKRKKKVQVAQETQATPKKKKHKKKKVQVAQETQAAPKKKKHKKKKKQKNNNSVRATTQQ